MDICKFLQYKSIQTAVFKVVLSFEADFFHLAEKDSIELLCVKIQMSVDIDLLKTLIASHKINPVGYLLHLDGKSYSLNSVTIDYSPTPVNEPTTRGGVYFSDKFAYKMKATVDDLSVIPLLTKKMLGPNTDFDDLKITANLTSSEQPLNFEIFTNLTNSVQTPNSIELSMIIIRLNTV